MKDISYVESICYEIISLLCTAQLSPLDADQLAKFGDYLALITRWNARTNLTAVRDPAGILQRHFIESIACAQRLPAGVKTLLDFGSGAGFPGIPIAICRPEIEVTLAESQGKKAAFLQEAVRALQLPVKVHAGRAETLKVEFDCVTLRAVDHMELAIRDAGRLVRLGGWLAAMTTDGSLSQIQSAVRSDFQFSTTIRLPASEDRILALALKAK